MSFVNGHYDGDDAKGIRALTRRKVTGAIKRTVNAMGVGSGENAVAVLTSMDSASHHHKNGRRFVVAVLPEPKTQRCRVLGTDNRAHQGYEFSWVVMLQMSNGKVGEATTGDEVVTSDDALIDAIRSGLESQYARFRDELGFENLKVEQGGQTNNNRLLNPLTLTFTNQIRLETDAFLTT